MNAGESTLETTGLASTGSCGTGTVSSTGCASRFSRGSRIAVTVGRRGRVRSCLVTGSRGRVVSRGCTSGVVRVATCRERG